MHRYRLKTFLIAALCLGVQLAHAEPARDETIREYMRASGQEASAVAGLERLLPLLKQLARNVPPDLFQELTRTDTLIASMYPIYRKYFSEQEMQELVAFHKTPVGAKLATLSDTLNRELLEEGARQARQAVMKYQVERGQFTVEPKPNK